MAEFFEVALLGYRNFKISTRHVQNNDLIITALLAHFPLNFKALLEVSVSSVWRMFRRAGAIDLHASTRLKGAM
jgi:hypothetical protein